MVEDKSSICFSGFVSASIFEKSKISLTILFNLIISSFIIPINSFCSSNLKSCP
ncbi:MAG: hypothetical protein LUE64_03110 [Candidatus Gastranaerophilales bacterium]|nr:hypothetical protein [Candidatus Gastranaerophilales bacterium]